MKDMNSIRFLIILCTWVSLACGFGRSRSICCRRTVTRNIFIAKVKKDLDEGYFNIGGEETNKSLPAEFPFVDGNEISSSYTDEDIRRVQNVMLLAFDNLQDFEIREMNEKIFRGMTTEHVNCQSNLNRIALQVEALQNAVNQYETLPFGTIEYMQDQYRSLLSQVRMYGKDAEWFTSSGDIVPLQDRGFKFPWSR